MSKDTNPYVSVIIPTYQDGDKLAMCLQALEQQSYNSDRFEVLVVDNNPDPWMPDFELSANVRLLREPTPGSYAARNRALSIAKGEIVAFTDADCVPHCDWLANAVEHLKSNPGLVRLGGRVHLMNKPEEEASLATLYEEVFAFPQQEYVEQRGAAITANMICYRHLFDSVGPFNPALMSGGDLEWGIRAEAANAAIGYASDSVVDHPVRDMQQLKGKVRRTAAGQYLMRRGVDRLLNMAIDLMPPVSAIKKTLNQPQLTSRQKFQLIALKCRFRLISFLEKQKLMFGKYPERS